MRSLFFLVQLIALVYALTARAGLTSTSYATCACTDVENTIKKNNAAVEAVNRRIARATQQSTINRLLRELQQISLQSEKNLAAAYATCQKKEAACRMEQNAASAAAAAQTAAMAAAAARPDVQTERNIDVNADVVIDEAPIESQLVEARPVSPRVSSGGTKSSPPTVIINSGSSAAKRVGGKTFAEVDVLPAFKESFADDPLMSPGVSKEQAVTPMFSLEQIAVNEGYVARGGRARAFAGNGVDEVRFRVYGAADRGPVSGSGGSTRGMPDHPSSRARAAKGTASRGHVKGVSASPNSRGPEQPASSVPVAGASEAKPADAGVKEPAWLKFIPKFIADSFFRPYYAIAPKKKRDPAADRSQIAGMHTDIFYNVNRAYILAGDSLKR